MDETKTGMKEESVRVRLSPTMVEALKHAVEAPLHYKRGGFVFRDADKDIVYEEGRMSHLGGLKPGFYRPPSTEPIDKVPHWTWGTAEALLRRGLLEPVGDARLYGRPCVLRATEAGRRAVRQKADEAL